MFSFFKKIIFKDEISKKNKEVQMAYISKIDPKDSFERSFFQYKCQMKKINWFFFILINVFSIVLLVIEKMNKNTSIYREKKDNVILFVHDIENVPNVYRDNSIMIENITGYVSDNETKQLGKALRKKYFWSFYFRAKIMKKAFFYNYLIKKYSPVNFVTSNEYSFTSSILTYFLEKRGILHINVMHGEKVFDISDSFFKFSKLYLWNDYYLELFRELKADISNYDFYIPYKRFNIEKKDKPSFDMIVYLQNQNKKEMKLLKNQLIKLEQMRIGIRPHPRYTNLKTMKSVFKGFYIEDYKCVTCEESISDTKYVVTMYSTVATQAYFSGIDILIDDISQPKLYLLLKNLDYKYANECMSLSFFINGKEE